jgi:hypothetical protein
MTLVSQATFAKICGKSRKTVTAWKKAGRLVTKGDRVDVEATAERMRRYHPTGSPIVLDSRQIAALAASEGNKSGNRGNTKRVTRVTSSAPTADDGDAADGLELRPGETLDQAAQRLADLLLDPASTTIEEARRVKEVYLALLNRVEYERKAGDLIDLDTARSVLFDCARAARDSWLNWPVRYAALIAADLNLDASDRVVEVLARYVHQQVADLGEPQPHFED